MKNINWKQLKKGENALKKCGTYKNPNDKEEHNINKMNLEIDNRNISGENEIEGSREILEGDRK